MALQKLERDIYFRQEIANVIAALKVTNEAHGGNNAAYDEGFNAALHGVALGLGIISIEERNRVVREIRNRTLEVTR